MRKFKVYGFIVLVILLVSVACSYSVHIDKTPGDAEDCNVLLVTTEVSMGSFIPTRIQQYYTKGLLPKDATKIGYCNGTFINFNGKTHILTAKHGILPVNYQYAIEAKNTQDVVLMPIDTLLEGMPVLTSGNEISGMCNFSFFHLLGTEEWHYRKVFGELIKPPFEEIYPKEHTEKLLKDRYGMLKFFSDDLWPKSIQINESNEIFITAKDIDSLFRVLRTRINVIQREAYDYNIKNCYIMEVSNDVAVHLAGPSGSSLRNEEGEIIGMYSRYRAPGPEYKQFAIFEKVDASMFE